jgi:class 3 adenylate cyclase/DNA-binding CsgD family transcriptional regulator
MGTQTLLLMDIAGSSRMVRRLGDRFDAVLAAYRDLACAIWTAHDGREVEASGDGCVVVFARADQAVAAAVAVTCAMAAYPWPDDGMVSLRVGLHTGEARGVNRGYGTIDVYRCAEIAAAAHGGQILLTHATADRTSKALPAGVTLRDLGEYRLKNFAAPERLFQVVVPGLREDFPPVRRLTPADARRDASTAGMTVREAEILRLIAVGRSNQEIATELMLSVRTVERHIENVYAKLGVHGQSARAAAAIFAVRHGLLIDD